MFPRCSRGNSRLRASWLLPEESALGEKLHLGASSPDLLLQGCSGQAGWLHWNIQARLEQPSWLLHRRDIPPHTSCVLTHPSTHICPSPLLGQHRANCRGTHCCVLAGGAHLSWFQVALPPPRTAPWLSPRLGPVSQSGGAQLISSAAKAGN